jgi:hypothetical protein
VDALCLAVTPAVEARRHSSEVRTFRDGVRGFWNATEAEVKGQTEYEEDDYDDGEHCKCEIRVLKGLR